MRCEHVNSKLATVKIKSIMLTTSRARRFKCPKLIPHVFWQGARAWLASCTGMLNSVPALSSRLMHNDAWFLLILIWLCKFCCPRIGNTKARNPARAGFCGMRICSLRADMVLPRCQSESVHVEKMALIQEPPSLNSSSIFSKDRTGGLMRLALPGSAARTDLEQVEQASKPRLMGLGARKRSQRQLVSI